MQAWVMQIPSSSLFLFIATTISPTKRPMAVKTTIVHITVSDFSRLVRLLHQLLLLKVSAESENSAVQVLRHSLPALHRAYNSSVHLPAINWEPLEAKRWNFHSSKILFRLESINSNKAYRLSITRLLEILYFHYLSLQLSNSRVFKAFGAFGNSWHSINSPWRHQFVAAKKKLEVQHD